jgi:hypothetical protein
MARHESKTPVGNIVPFGLRMQPGLKADLESAAEANGRSLTAEIIARLTETLEHQSEIVKTISSHSLMLAEHDNGLSEHERRLEKLESRIEDIWSMVRNEDSNPRD